ncbi:MAG TPA: tRNA (guanosine(37)-N1)-methyltransferase TrmD [Candidatus Woesebacteria bacterium]|jgi:tRNA (guanine37-N1)-methyltransferase|nr:tRNA (guanosine(37)-N1)-methyltransferase TrmD [Candidatus Shapirobacteria bacterium]HOR02280.1 tRNA (guanosine(37)-N1)-methyltransferase TrmD [Candidatus Woesebacteria bacterium]
MKIDVLTLFPKMFDSPFGESIVKRAIKNKIIELKIYNLRDWAIDSYGTVDDKPFGGGVGMLIRPEPVYEALKKIKSEKKTNKRKIVLMSARGKKFTQEMAENWSKLDNLIIIAGHYEGFDQRIADFMVDEEISIGDYVLTGGELPAMVVIDAVTRLLPGVLGKDESSSQESWSEIEIDGKKIRTKEYPQYTRPREFMGKSVPKVLVSGDPKKIKAWQIEQIKKELK